MTALAQAPSVTPPSQAPFVTQLKKTIVFIQTDCVRRPSVVQILPVAPQIESFFGTGFFLFVPDERVGSDRGFLYLVTNRHVAQPGVEQDRPCEVANYSVRLNLKAKDSDQNQVSKIEPLGREPNWFFPADPSVDLAVCPFNIDQNVYDFQTIPANLITTSEMIRSIPVTEGDEVMFAGLFVQYTGKTRMEPIVRQGSLAMLPSGTIQTTLNKLGKVYLAEVHVFGGNSGSPMFVNVGGIRGNRLGGAEYKLLGVVSGEFYESSNFELQPAATYKGAVLANSGISMVVPGEELKKLIESPPLQQLRDQVVAREKAVKSSSP
jgi:hypothetical protein